MAKKEFPEAIKKEGVNGEEILFLSKTIQSNNKEKFVLMKATNNSVHEIDMSDMDAVKGTELPVYIKLLTTHIYSGKLMYA